MIGVPDQRIPTKDPKQVQTWSVTVGLHNFIENILFPNELGSNSARNSQTGTSWSFDKLNKVSLFWPCDDIVNSDFGFNEKIPCYVWLIHLKISTGWDLYPWCKYWLLCNQNLLILLYAYNCNVHNSFLSVRNATTNFMVVHNISFQIIYRLFFFRTRNSFSMGTSAPFSESKCFKICPALPGTVPKNITEIVIIVYIVLVILIIWRNWKSFKI